MAFRRCFLRPLELTKMVLQKFYKILLHQIKLHHLAKRTEPKRFFLFSRVTYHTGRDQTKGTPLSVLFRHCETFSPEIFSPKGPTFNFLIFCDKMDVETPQRVHPFSFYWHCETFFQKIFLHKRVPNSPIL